jgi:hypothetical protein
VVWKVWPGAIRWWRNMRTNPLVDGQHDRPCFHKSTVIFGIDIYSPPSSSVPHLITFRSAASYSNVGRAHQNICKWWHHGRHTVHLYTYTNASNIISRCMELGTCRNPLTIAASAGQQRRYWKARCFIFARRYNIASNITKKQFRELIDPCKRGVPLYPRKSSLRLTTIVTNENRCVLTRAGCPMVSWLRWECRLSKSDHIRELTVK